jgi:putative oxidoreductase
MSRAIPPSVATGLETFGRCVVGALFIAGGLHKAIDPTTPIRMMSDAGLQPVALLLPLTLLFQIFAGCLVAWGGRAASSAALLLAGYCLLVNITLHRFWTFTGLEFEHEISLFFKNIAIAGALVMIAGRLASQTQSAHKPPCAKPD